MSAPPRFAGTLAALFCLSLAPTAGAGWVSRDAAIMGTSVRVAAWHEDDATAEAGVAAVLAEMRRIDAAMSPYRPDSEISRVNARAAREPVAVSAEFAALLQRARAFSELTEGAFDITYASVGHLYSFRDRRRPQAGAVARRRGAVDYRHVRIEPRGPTVRFTHPDVRIDLGGIAKGYAVERGATLLRERGIAHGQVTAGGDTRLLGDRLGRPWVIGIQDPRDPEALVARIPVADEAVSTSGDYERYFDEDGVRYHHILDPRTGDSARAVRSVTVLGPDATSTDALSTSVFVLGSDAGLALIDRQEGFEAVVVDAAGRMRFSAGLQDLGAAAPGAAGRP